MAEFFQRDAGSMGGLKGDFCIEEAERQLPAPPPHTTELQPENILGMEQEKQTKDTEAGTSTVSSSSAKPFIQRGQAVF